MGLPISVCTFVKICGEKVFTLIYVAKSLTLEKLVWGSRTILFCFSRQIKVPKLGALTFFKVSQERWGNLSHLGSDSSSGGDSGGSCIVLCTDGVSQAGEKPISSALPWRARDPQMLKGALICSVAGTLRNTHWNITKWKSRWDFWNYPPGSWAVWAHLLTLTRRVRRWEGIFTLCFAGAGNALDVGLWMEITSWTQYAPFFTAEKSVIQYHCLCHFITPRNGHKK